MRILITGGAGFIGSNLAKRLLAAGHAITIIDDLSSGKQEMIPEGASVIAGNVTDPTLIKKAMEGKDAAVHLAAMISVLETIKNPAEAERVNVQGSLNVLEAAREAKVKKAVLASSAAVYGFTPRTPTKETERPKPGSPYAATKLAMEAHAARYTRDGLPCLCLRFFNVYGPGQDPGSQYAAVIPAFISRALKNEPLTIYGDGTQTRDFIFVADVCAAIERGLATGSGTINIATGRSVTINELARTIIRLTGSTSRIIHHAARPGDPQTSLADVTKANEELGFTATTTLEHGLRETIAWFRRHDSKRA